MQILIKQSERQRRRRRRRISLVLFSESINRIIFAPPLKEPLNKLEKRHRLCNKVTKPTLQFILFRPH